MKTAYFTPFFVLLWLISLQSAAKTPLFEALKQKQAACTISGGDPGNRSPSAHYGPCMRIVVVNLTASPLEISLEPGRLLLPEDTLAQTMMVVVEGVLALKPKGTDSLFVEANCTELSNHCPAFASPFKMGTMATGKLLQIAQTIDKLKKNGSAGQNAVWAISDNYPVYNIGSDNADLERYLRNSVSEITGRSGSLQQTPRVTYTLDVIKGKLSYEVDKPRTVNIVFCDSAGNVIEELKKNRKETPAQYNFGFEYRTNTLKYGKYYIRLTDAASGLILREVEIDYNQNSGKIERTKR